MGAIGNHRRYNGGEQWDLSKEASMGDENFGLLALCKEASVGDDDFGLLALCKEASSDKGRGQRPTPDKKQTIGQLMPAHIAGLVPFASGAYGYFAGGRDGKRETGVLFGQQAILGERDKEQGVAGQNLAGVVGTGMATGAALGAGAGYAGHQLSKKRNIQVRPTPTKAMLGLGAIGALSVGGVGAARYGTGSYLADGPKR